MSQWREKDKITNTRALLYFFFVNTATGLTISCQKIITISGFVNKERSVSRCSCQSQHCISRQFPRVFGLQVDANRWRSKYTGRCKEVTSCQTRAICKMSNKRCLNFVLNSTEMDGYQCTAGHKWILPLRQCCIGE